MRAAHVLVCAWGALVCVSGFVACAESAEESSPATPDEADTGPTVIPDSGAPVRDASSVPDAADAADAAEESRCNDAGWCVTALPDPDLVLRDIWPIGERAFAIAESPTLGAKVLEWSEAESAWGYIDDGSQHVAASVSYVGGIWAPSEDEVYFGVAPGYIFHGVRPVAPATAWTWTSHALEDRSHPSRGVNPEDGYPFGVAERRPALGVWGTSASDVYAWFTNSIYHWKSVDGGAPGWVLEYSADDPATPTGAHETHEHLYFTGAAGTSPDDVWFTGARGRAKNGCALVVRKTEGEYRRVADGTLNAVSGVCTRRGTTLLLGARGSVSDLQALSPGELIGLNASRAEALRITVNDAAYAVAVARADGAVSFPGIVNGLWGSDRDVWLSGKGFVLRGSDVWDGGAFEFSRVSQANGPIDRQLYKLRGTSNSNLWAIGEGYALHKTTP